ncbi:hypothetical protein COZ60_04845 [Candidatus Bathyarchaeota archaeon CG_4_8_14_3_um_filter_42_8]|nr:MAG: hypothetical protein COZ60_04845 [Candidatus Bathyarchaeota archaeon CG_4_8_14_3_um_filter_42_8]
MATIEEADIRNKPKLYLILFVGLVLLLASSTISCGQNPGYIYENGAVVVGGDGEPIELINNPNATNPTYAELVAFIEEDSTDERQYLTRAWAPGFAYTCADFAEDVHNNAEAAGIKAAWVGIDFEENDEGHALNAFETTDKGLVYIDCTGRRFFPWLPKYNATSWDKVAYVEVGKEYGVIDIAKAKSPSYSFYEEYTQKWQEFEKKQQELEKLLSEWDKEVTRHNEEISKYGSSLEETTRFSVALEENTQKRYRLGDELRALQEELGDYWFEPLGIVKDVQIHW